MFITVIFANQKVVNFNKLSNKHLPVGYSNIFILEVLTKCVKTLVFYSHCSFVAFAHVHCCEISDCTISHSCCEIADVVMVLIWNFLGICLGRNIRTI